MADTAPTDTAANETVRVEHIGDVTVVTFDDGKANALSHDAIRAITAALDAAAGDAKAVVLAGRPGRFSAGFDLSVMKGGPDDVRALVRAGADLALRLYTFPRPVVLAATGHALAAGAILLMSGDVRIGAEGAFKIGLNEVSIGMPVPHFAVELARDRLSRRHLTSATLLAAVYDPQGARDAGYLDAVVAPESVVAAAVERATALAATLSTPAFEATRATLREPVAAAIRARLDDDLRGFFVAG
jgi:enoyl-CoA hydratase